MKNFWIIIMFFIQSSITDNLVGQITYHSHIKPILNNHCTVCHYKDGPAPFPLTNVEDVKKRARFISYVTETKLMPPWKADPAFQHYRNERLLSEDELHQIKTWAADGAPIGNPSTEKTEGEKKSTESKADLSLKMGESFRIPSTNKDDFRFFYLPAKNTDEKFITGIEFVPGNKKRVHHSRIMVDTTGVISGINGLSEMDTAVYQFQQSPLADEFLYGWVPGNFVFRFPKGFGKRLPANSNLILNVHYSPSIVDDTDRSGVNLYVTSQKDITREVKTFILRENDITNKPFLIPAGEKPTFYLSSGVLEKDMSLLTVQPHAHLLGKSFRAFAITPDGDVIPLVKVDAWDFDWQTIYEFKKLIHIPAGSVILMEGQYDNTMENPRNPHFPPRDAGYGWRTVDEMMNLIFYYTDYLPGDEEANLEYSK